jgi:hypothetical protein
MRASEKGPTPRGCREVGGHARLIGEFEEPFPGVWQQGLDLDWRASARGAGSVLARYRVSISLGRVRNMLHQLGGPQQPRTLRNLSIMPPFALRPNGVIYRQHA